MENKETPGKLSVSRRQFIKGAGTLAMAAGVAGIAGLTAIKKPVLAAGLNESADHQWAFVFDLRLCDGCKKCTDACQKEHFLPVDIEWIKVYTVDGPLGQPYYLPKPCMHCQDAPCNKVCPVHATFKTLDGATLIDQQKCIGCRMCMAACPYRSRYFNWSQPAPVPSTLPKPTPEFSVPQVKGTVGKCDMCLHNTRFGQLPACVSACEMRAANIGDLVTDILVNPDETRKLSLFLQENDAYRLNEELGTQPHAYYVAGHGQNYHYGGSNSQ